MTDRAPALETPPRWWATRRGRLLLTALAAALIAAVATPLIAMRRMMDARPVAERAVAAAVPGEQLDVAIELAAAAEGALSGAVLEQVAGTRYRRTPRTMAVRWTAATPIVMGQRDDVRAGAIVQVRGRLDARATLDADRLVVLTGYVEVR